MVSAFVNIAMPICTERYHHGPSSHCSLPRAGVIDKLEFRHETFALGIDATLDEIDALFHSLDVDGGGTLDASEVKEALREMIGASETMKETTRRLKGEIADMEKLAKAVQAEWRKWQAAEEAEAVEKAEKAAAASAEAEEERAKAKLARNVAAEEKRQQAAAEKAAMEARVAAKRQVR